MRLRKSGGTPGIHPSPCRLREFAQDTLSIHISHLVSSIIQSRRSGTVGSSPPFQRREKEQQKILPLCRRPARSKAERINELGDPFACKGQIAHDVVEL
jgi:hypothetical protein